MATLVLFLAADPRDAARLRLGEELREIDEKLRLSRLRRAKSSAGLISWKVRTLPRGGRAR